MLEFIIDDIKKTLDDFHKVTGFTISLYDEHLSPIYHAAPLAPVCYELRKHPELIKKCHVCEEYGHNTCEQTRKPFVYRCHAGFIEAHIPICENNVIIGYMLTGHLVCNENTEFIKNKLTEYAKDYNMDPEMLFDKLEQMGTVDREYIESTVNLIKTCASYLYLSRIIKKSSYVLSNQLKEYIDNHYTEDMSVKNLCDKMYISKTKLYRLSMKAFGMGSSEYVMQKRIDAAKTMLETSDKNIYKIAEEVGFDDTNYFTRIFKKIVGMTPSQYKKSR